MKITITPSIGDDIEDVIVAACETAKATGNPVLVDGDQKGAAQKFQFYVRKENNPVAVYRDVYLKQLNQ